MIGEPGEGGGGKIDMKVMGMYHSTDQIGTQKSRLI